MNKEFALILRIGGISKYQRLFRDKKYGKKKGWLNGMTEYRKKPEGFKVWINSRQSQKEMVDSFFHEMVHVLVHILGFTRKELSEERCELLCNWVGYLAKSQFIAEVPQRFINKKVKV